MFHATAAAASPIGHRTCNNHSNKLQHHHGMALSCCHAPKYVVHIVWQMAAASTGHSATMTGLLWAGTSENLGSLSTCALASSFEPIAASTRERQHQAPLTGFWQNRAPMYPWNDFNFFSGWLLPSLLINFSYFWCIYSAAKKHHYCDAALLPSPFSLCMCRLL